MKCTEEAGLVVVGAGPAGLIGAIEAARAGIKVVLLEARREPAGKLLASGGGRCNLTNTLPPQEMAERFPAHHRFVAAILRRFPADALRAWFAELGVETHAPDGFHVFPQDHKAATVRNALLTEAKRRGVSLRTGCEVEGLERGSALTVKTAGCGGFKAPRVLVAAGGVGYPGLGDGGAVWRLLAELGHTVVPPVPAMVPLETRERWVGRCRADTLPKVELSLAGKRGGSWSGDLLFTAGGIAGPVVLDASGSIAAVLESAREVAIRVRLRGGWSPEAWRQHLERVVDEGGRETLRGWLERETTSPSLTEVLLAALRVEGEVSAGELPRAVRNQVCDWLGGISLTVTGTAGFGQAMVTRGGVSVREVTSPGLESRVAPGLHLAGEVLDVDGPCGGYNLQWAFASGYEAARDLIRR